MNEIDGELVEYSEGESIDVEITEIIVPTKYDKDQLLKAFEYIHDLASINTDYVAVNTIVHMYLCPERIVVNPFKVPKQP